MNRIVYCIWIILLSNGCSVLNTVSNGTTASEALTNDIKVSDVKINSTQKNYHRLLIFGAGSQAVRLFLDNLSEKLNNGFKIKDIQSTYYFLGNDSTEEKKNYREITSAESFDAILVFIQTDMSAVTDRVNPYPFGLRSTKLDQTFTMKIYEFADHGTSIWDAILKVNCNFTKDKVYADISSRIFKDLQANKITAPHSP